MANEADKATGSPSAQYGMQKYVAIITSEDERYRLGWEGKPVGKQLSYWAENPWDGSLVDIVYGSSIDTLLEGCAEYEGLFYYLYSTVTGERIAYGTLDPDSPREELEEFELEQKATSQIARMTTTITFRHTGCKLISDRFHGRKEPWGKFVLAAFSDRPHAGKKVFVKPHCVNDQNFLHEAPWDGLFEDVLYGNEAKDFYFGFLDGCGVQLFRRDTGKCIYSGLYSSWTVSHSIDAALRGADGQEE